MKRKHKQAIYIASAIAIIAVMAFAYFFASQDEAQYVHAGPEVQTGAIQLISRSETEVSSITFWAMDSLTYMRPFYDEVGALQWSYSDGDGFVLDYGRTRDKARSAWALTVPEVLHENAQSLNLADFELLPARLVVEISYNDGTSHSVRLGGLTTDLAHRFLMIDDDPAIYLISAFAAERLMADVGDLIDLRLPNFDFDMAFYIGIRQYGHEPIELLVQGPVPADQPPGWSLVMTKPFTGFRVREVITAEELANARLLYVAEVVPDCLEEFGLTEPVLEFEFHDMYEEVKLLFGNTFSDGETEFIYVKIEGRPHVFVAEYAHMQVLFDLNPLDFILRLIMLVSILEVYAVKISSVNENFEMFINHDADDERVIHPTINGIEVDESAFRAVYQMIIGLSVDSPVETFTPTDEPELTIDYHFIQQDNRNIRFFSRDAQFFYVSIDGGDIQFVINRRAVERMLGGVRDLA